MTTYTSTHKSPRREQDNVVRDVLMQTDPHFYCCFFLVFPYFFFISTVIFFTKQLFMLYPSKFFLLSPVYPKCLRHTSYFSIFKGSGIHEEASLTSASSICSRYRILQHISSLLPSFINAFECMASSSRSPVPMF